ncbi:hypothetical protein HNY73_021215 [Argiope bruennichi]|uniref:Uncharacterized protein n=1 Tax=Argiope bruennichi TaxID=94029 RepID=A0A8T0ED78_ARGBR|nr:hypothetical protein HNY73_021215 [Argiope bruennichi]
MEIKNRQATVNEKSAQENHIYCSYTFSVARLPPWKQPLYGKPASHDVSHAYDDGLTRHSESIKLKKHSFSLL